MNPAADIIVKLLLGGVAAGIWTLVGLAFKAGGRLASLEVAAAHALRVPDLERVVAVHGTRLDTHAEEIARLRTGGVPA